MMDASNVSMVPWCVVLVAAVIGAVTDTTTRRLPNMLTFPLWLTGLAWSAWAGGVGGFGSAFAASVLVALPFVVLFVLAKGGAGDAKMMAGVGAWLGVTHGLVALAAVSIAGGLAALLVAVCRREGKLVARNLAGVMTGACAVAGGQLRPREAMALMPSPSAMHRFPYGIAILLGCAGAFAGVQPWVIV